MIQDELMLWYKDNYDFSLLEDTRNNIVVHNNTYHCNSLLQMVKQCIRILKENFSGSDHQHQRPQIAQKTADVQQPKT